LNLMEEYASYIARYSGEDSAHRKKVRQIMNETQKIVESSKEYASTVGKMEAQQAIARVGADQIAMLAMQNVMLANMTDILADEVVLLSKIGLAETEEYSEAIRRTLEDYIDIYSGIRGNNLEEDCPFRRRPSGRISFSFLRQELVGKNYRKNDE